MEQLYRTSRIPREGTYFQRLPREITNLTSLYDYDCNFDVDFFPIYEGKSATLEFRFKGMPGRIFMDVVSYLKVNLQSWDPVSRDLSITSTDPKNIVEVLLQEVQRGMNIHLQIGRKSKIIFENLEIDSRIFSIRSGDGSMSITDVPLCRQLVSALLKMYPPR